MIFGRGELNLAQNFEITKSNRNSTEKLQDMWAQTRDNQTASVNKIQSQLEEACSPDGCFHVEELILHQVVNIKWPNVVSAWRYNARPENAMVTVEQHIKLRIQALSKQRTRRWVEEGEKV